MVQGDGKQAPRSFPEEMCIKAKEQAQAVDDQLELVGVVLRAGSVAPALLGRWGEWWWWARTSVWALWRPLFQSSSTCGPRMSQSLERCLACTRLGLL